MSKTPARKPSPDEARGLASEAKKPKSGFDVTKWPMHHLLMIERQHMLNSNRVLRPFGIDHRHWRLLVNLQTMDGASINDLAQKTGFERSTLSKIMQQAQDKGLVHRVIAEGDRRRMSIFITPKGAATISECAPSILKLFNAYFQSMDESELLSFMALLKRLRERVEIVGLTV